MQVAVLGLGRFGSQLVMTLADQGHEVLAVDTSEAEVTRVAAVAAKAAIADIQDEAALRDLNVAAMDVAIVATPGGKEWVRRTWPYRAEASAKTGVPTERRNIP